MVGWFNPTTYSPAAAAQLRYALASQAQTNPYLLQQLGLLQQYPQLGGADAWRAFQSPDFMRGPCGCVPPPRIDFSGAPAGRGLAAVPESEGFGKAAVRDAAGYTIVPTGQHAAVKVFAPGAKAGDQPYLEVSGDPHIYMQKDGKMQHVSDFTKDSLFRLPSGTQLAFDTTSDTGQSVTQSVKVLSANDSVTLSGVNGGSPTRGEIAQTGYIDRANLAKQDEFILGGTNKDGRLYLEKNGQLEQVTGTDHNFDGQNSYRPVTVKTKANGGTGEDFFVDPSLKAPWGTPAWGNQLREESVDIARRLYGKDGATQVAQLMEADHVHGLLTQALGYPPDLFGGYGQWGGWPQLRFSVGGLMSSLAQNELYFQLLNQSRAGSPILA